MKVCVIGAGGFIGARIAARLAADPDVTALSLLDHAPFAAPAAPHVRATVATLRLEEKL